MLYPRVRGEGTCQKSTSSCAGAAGKKTKRSGVRASLQPGVIAIILRGRFKGRHVIVLGQANGDQGRSSLVVTAGPYACNGVPMRRIDPAYLIATQTRIDLSALDTSALTSDIFKIQKKDRKRKGEGDFMGDCKTNVARKPKYTKEFRDVEKVMDQRLMETIKKDERRKALLGYLRSVFTINSGDMPHRMKF